VGWLLFAIGALKCDNGVNPGEASPPRRRR
jgi:hypothetical protein